MSISAKIVGVSALAVLSVGAAYADDWAGYYGGLHLGYGSGDYMFTSTVLSEGNTVQVNGAIGGLTFGRNWQNGTSVYGLVIDISSGPNGSQPEGTNEGLGWMCGTGDCISSIDRFATIRGRYGVEAMEGIAFVTGGAAVADTTGGMLNSAQYGGGRKTGYTIGFGYERMVGENSSLGLEALFVDLGDIPYGEGGTGEGPNSLRGAGDFAVIRAGWNLHF